MMILAVVVAAAVEVLDADGGEEELGEEIMVQESASTTKTKG